MSTHLDTTKQYSVTAIANVFAITKTTIRKQRQLNITKIIMVTIMSNAMVMTLVKKRPRRRRRERTTTMTSTTTATIISDERESERREGVQRI